MPAPVISNTQGTLTFAVGQNFIFQLSASNSPTSWELSSGQTLPPGSAFSPSTGTLSGAISVAGVWGLTFTATNSSGVSSPLTFTIGAFDVGIFREITKKTLIHTGTWAVTFDDPAAELKIPGGATLPATVGQVRYGDDVVFRLVFTDGVAEYAPRLVTARLCLKGADSEPPFLVTNDIAFKKSVDYLAGGFVTTYYITANISSPALLPFLNDNEDDSGTHANVLAEFDLHLERPTNANGPSVTRQTTRPFLLRVTRSLINGAASSGAADFSGGLEDLASDLTINGGYY